MSSKFTRADRKRLYELFTLLTGPFEGEELDYLTPESKLWYVIRPDIAPIWRRKILRPIRVQGLWWMEEGQWTRFLWQGHHAQVIRCGQDQDKVLAVRLFQPGMAYFRQYTEEPFIDMEAMVRTTRWDPKKGKKLGTTREWLTVTLTQENYKRLDEYLSPVDDQCCNHKEGYYDLPDE